MDEVDPVPQWIHSVVSKMEEVSINITYLKCLGKVSSQYFISFPKQSVVPKQFVDQAVLNVYHDQGAGLGVHQGQLYPFLLVCLLDHFA